MGLCGQKNIRACWFHRPKSSRLQRTLGVCLSFSPGQTSTRPDDFVRSIHYARSIIEGAVRLQPAPLRWDEAGNRGEVVTNCLATILPLGQTVPLTPCRHLAVNTLNRPTGDKEGQCMLPVVRVSSWLVLLNPANQSSKRESMAVFGPFPCPPDRKRSFQAGQSSGGESPKNTWKERTVLSNTRLTIPPLSPPRGSCQRGFLLTQHFPCFRNHCRNLPIAKGCNPVLPIGHPMYHSAHGGFKSPPIDCIRFGPPRCFGGGAAPLNVLASRAVNVGYNRTIPVNVSRGLEWSPRSY